MKTIKAVKRWFPLAAVFGALACGSGKEFYMGCGEPPKAPATAPNGTSGSGGSAGTGSSGTGTGSTSGSTGTGSTGSGSTGSGSTGSGSTGSGSTGSGSTGSGTTTRRNDCLTRGAAQFSPVPPYPQCPPGVLGIGG